MEEIGVGDAWPSEMNPAVNSGKIVEILSRRSVIQPGDFIRDGLVSGPDDRW